MRTLTAVSAGPRDPVDAYLADLDAALRGPRRVREDLLAEARDGLADAVDAYEAAGCDPAEARRRALEEFGDVAAVAPEYQRELTAAQGRRTALAALATHLTVFVEGELIWRIFDFWHGQRPDHAYLLLAHTTNLVSYAVIGALIAVLLTYGRLARYVPLRLLVRGIGGLAFFVLGFLLLTGPILSLATPVASAGALAVVVTLASILVPGVVIGVVVGRGARRCLVLSG